MRDLKPYRAWHVNMHEPKREPRIVTIFSWVVLSIMMWMLAWFVVTAIEKQAKIDEAYHHGRRDMRLQILKANQDIVKGNEAYIKQMDDLIAKEYRSKHGKVIGE